VAATAASNSASAVPVPMVDNSRSARLPSSRAGVELAGGPPVVEAVPSGLAVRLGVGVMLLVGLVSLVALADGNSVFVCVGVAEGPSVGPGPIEGVMVGVGETVGAMVVVKVEVAAGVSVDALVGVEVATGVSVDAFVGVVVAGGARTVKELLFNLTDIPLPLGSVAAALLSVSGEVPGAAPTSTVKITLATVPLGIAS
jgi:hypothetical protein